MNTKNLTPWPKGVSGNPLGTVRLPPEIRAERKRNQAQLIRLVISFFAMNDADAKAKSDDIATTQLERAVQGMIAKSREGDTTAFKYLMELVCGRIPDADPESPAEEMTAAEKLELMRRAVATLETQVIRDGSGPAEPPG